MERYPGAAVELCDYYRVSMKLWPMDGRIKFSRHDCFGILKHAYMPYSLCSGFQQ